jgi:hypothetical protein
MGWMRKYHGLQEDLARIVGGSVHDAMRIVRGGREAMVEHVRKYYMDSDCDSCDKGDGAECPDCVDGVIAKGTYQEEQCSCKPDPEPSALVRARGYLDKSKSQADPDKALSQARSAIWAILDHLEKEPLPRVTVCKCAPGYTCQAHLVVSDIRFECHSCGKLNCSEGVCIECFEGDDS